MSITSSTFSKEAIDVAIAAWFGITQVSPNIMILRERMAAAIQAANEVEGFVQCTLEATDSPQTVERAAQELIELAAGTGHVVTITLQPRQPFAMGSYNMVAEVREQRK
ncbi:MAG: hypothetical protein EON54_20865 [Alcaligenaceae bacterium]|nr:MAG: hypothetical protein EON54_20865 [Alcaligenaceae bacterium]